MLRKDSPSWGLFLAFVAEFDEIPLVKSLRVSKYGPE